jgi:L-alanine-DL-glutamate epimerase-like enolase superfamily enzyme
MRDFSNHAPTRGEGRDVEITGIDTCVLKGNFEWNLVAVHTDAGVTGIGESYRGGGVTGIMEYMERFLVGENPLDVVPPWPEVSWTIRRNSRSTSRGFSPTRKRSMYSMIPVTPPPR